MEWVSEGKAREEKNRDRKGWAGMVYMEQGARRRMKERGETAKVQYRWREDGEMRDRVYVYGVEKGWDRGESG